MYAISKHLMLMNHHSLLDLLEPMLPRLGNIYVENQVTNMTHMSIGVKLGHFCKL